MANDDRSDTNDATTASPEQRTQREVKFEYSPYFPQILEHLGASLLVSTYQAGKLGVIGTHSGRLTFSFLNYIKAMGVAVGPRRIAVGSLRDIHFLHPAPELARAIEPAGVHDACWLTRGTHHTGNIHIHELAWGGTKDEGRRAKDEGRRAKDEGRRAKDEGRRAKDEKGGDSDSSFVLHPSSVSELWVVNTLFSCLCTLHDEYSFVPRWRPPFVSELIAQDRCHLNGLAIDDGRPRYVTAHGQSNDPAGWRADKATGGILIDVDSGEVVARNLAMPHSPRLYNDRLWVLDSGAGSIDVVDRETGRRESVERVPGFTRGLDFHGQFAFVGLSKIRETSVFGGVPIAQRRDELRAGVAVIDLVSGRAVAALQFHAGVDEIFSVNVLPGSVYPAFRGPQPEDDDMQEIWLVPPEGRVPDSDAHDSLNGKPQTPAFDDRDGAGDARAGQNPVKAHMPLTDQAPMLTARTQQPAGPDALFRAAMDLGRQGRLPQALSTLKQASALAPERADVLTELGNLYQQLNDQHTALACYRQAVRVNPDFVPARQNLGYLLFNHGEPEEAIEHYEHALRHQPSPVNRLLAATVLPVVYDSAEDVEGWRKRLADGVRRLADEGLTVDTTNTLVPTSFFMAYQGGNNVEIARDLGRIFEGCDKERSDAGPPTLEDSVAGGPARPESRLSHPTDRPSDDGRIRVAFLSAYFRDHTIGRQNIGRIEHLSRDDFEVTVISVGEHRDEMATRFRNAADRYVVVPRDVAAARAQISQLHSDVLVFTDVGMDALTYTLAFSRMARVQCATWGHPDTTGSPTMDYFLSSELLETAEADSHYTEKLVRLPNLGIYYERPQVRQAFQPDSDSPQGRSKNACDNVAWDSVPSGVGTESQPTNRGPLKEDTASRESFGFAPNRHIYLCPQTLFKFHPDFDALLAGILERDPHGNLVLLEGRVPNWTERLKRRFERTLPGGCERVRFLPAQPNQDFLCLLAAADVILDPHHFGGGNTSYEALAAGTPIITWPGALLRGRITAALYRKMGMTDLIVDSAEEYIEWAVRVGENRSLRDEFRQRILAGCSVLFEDPDEVRSLEECLRSLIGKTV